MEKYDSTHRMLVRNSSLPYKSEQSDFLHNKLKTFPPEHTRTGRLPPEQTRNASPGTHSNRQASSRTNSKRFPRNILEHW